MTGAACYRPPQRAELLLCRAYCRSCKSAAGGGAAPPRGLRESPRPPSLMAARYRAPRRAQRTRPQAATAPFPRRTAAAAGEGAHGRCAQTAPRRRPQTPDSTPAKAAAGGGRAAGDGAQQRQRAQGSRHPRDGQPPGRRPRGARSRQRPRRQGRVGTAKIFSTCGGAPQSLSTSACARYDL